MSQEMRVSFLHMLGLATPPQGFLQARLPMIPCLCWGCCSCAAL